MLCNNDLYAPHGLQCVLSFGKLDKNQWKEATQIRNHSIDSQLFTIVNACLSIRLLCSELVTAMRIINNCLHNNIHENAYFVLTRLFTVPRKQSGHPCLQQLMVLTKTQVSVFFIIDNEFIPFVYISNGVLTHFQQTLCPEGQSHVDFGLI